MGANTYLGKDHGGEITTTIELIRSTEEENAQILNVRSYQGARNDGASEVLKPLEQSAHKGKNLFAALVEAVKTHRLGQISHALYEVGGVSAEYVIGEAHKIQCVRGKDMADGGEVRVPRVGGIASDATPEAYPVDTSVELQSLIAKYERHRRAQSVSFRKLVPWIKVGERATHYVHPYPAKLLPQIAHFFLAAGRLAPRDAIVLDPFGGTGTVALEAILSGRNALYADVNPLARLIAKVKTTFVDTAKVASTVEDLARRYRRLRRGDTPDVVNIEYWYAPDVIRNLSILRRVIFDLPDDEMRALLLITFSATARKLSLADSRLSVPVRSKNRAESSVSKKDVWLAFELQLAANVRRMDALRKMVPRDDNVATCVGDDARKLRDDKSRSLRCETVDLIVTSPPYAGAQKYIRASSLNLGWLGLAPPNQLADLERRSIGREHFRRAEISQCPTTTVSTANSVIKKVWERDKVRALICASYINDMEAALFEMARVLKPGGHLVLVIGNNEVCSYVFRSSSYLQELCERVGLRTRVRLIDAIKSRGLMTKRNRSAGVISREWVILFQKPAEPQQSP